MKWPSVGALAALTLLSRIALAQQAPTLLTGRVTDAAGAPVAGATVTLDQMGLATSTDTVGGFRLVVPAARATGQEAVLSVRRLGFRPSSRSIRLTEGEQHFAFVLAVHAAVLQQVVITGEGIVTTNEKLGETVNTVDGAALVGSNESNVVNALSGKAPNVQVQSQSGDPGSSTNVQIRGIKSLSGDGQPLFVVDGVPLDNSVNSVQWTGADVVSPNRIADVNPNDIESVTILKGAAASAIYGARAEQGVVLITTKSGQPGRTRYALTASFATNDVTQGYPLQRAFGQGDGIPGNPQGSCPTLNCIASGTSWGPPLPAQTATYDHFSEMFETGNIYDVSLSISGGDDQRSFLLAVGYTANQGDVVGPNDSYDRATIRLKGSQMLGDRMQLSANVNYVNAWGSFIQRGNNISGIMLGGLRSPPEFNNFYYLDSISGLHRSYQFPNPDATSDTLSRQFDNPIWSVMSQPASSALERFYGNFTLNWSAEQWFTLQWIPGLDYYTDARFEALPFTSSSNPYGSVTRVDFKQLILSSVLTMIAQHTFTPDLSGSLTLGSELNSTHGESFTAAGSNLITPSPLVLTNTVHFTTWDAETFVHRQSYFAQATGDLWDQLYLTAAIRNDGFSTFAQNDPRAWYPKFSAAWTFTRTTGTSGEGALQFGKLRAAFGETGKEPEPYSTLNTYIAPFLGVPGVTSSPSLGNDHLAPERQQELEGGVDLGFFRGLVNLSFTAYLSKANDVILELPVPLSSGASTQLENGASIQNKGFEGQLGLTSPASSRSVQWSLGLLWGQNRNTVLSIANGVSGLGVGNTFYGVAQVGAPVGAITGAGFARCGYGRVLNEQADQVATACAGQPKGALYIAADGYPILDDSNRVLGSAQPDWAGSIRGSITVLRTLQFSFLVDIRHGSQAYNGTRGALYYYGVHKDTEIRGTMQVFGSASWRPGPVVGPGAGLAVLIDQNWFEGPGGSFSANTADFVEDAGFTKLREIAVQYTLDGRWVTEKVGLSSLSLRLAGRNLATWTEYTGIDPESNLTGAKNGLVQNVDWFNNPQARSMVLSVGLNR